MLFERPGYEGPRGMSYEVMAGGQRFLMIVEDDPESRLTQAIVVLNWFEELKRWVPVGR